MELAGLCQVDGKPGILKRCAVCGAEVCAGHLLQYGCALCRGRKQFK